MSSAVKKGAIRPDSMKRRYRPSLPSWKLTYAPANQRVKVARKVSAR
jgi:hypothetical protein